MFFQAWCLQNLFCRQFCLRNLLINLLLDAQSRNLKTHTARVLEESEVNLLHSEINQIATEVSCAHLSSTLTNSSTKPINFSRISYLNSMRVNYLKYSDSDNTQKGNCRNQSQYHSLYRNNTKLKQPNEWLMQFQWVATSQVSFHYAILIMMLVKKNNLLRP